MEVNAERLSSVVEHHAYFTLDAIVYDSSVLPCRVSDNPFRSGSFSAHLTLACIQ